MNFYGKGRMKGGVEGALSIRIGIDPAVAKAANGAKPVYFSREVPTLE